MPDLAASSTINNPSSMPGQPLETKPLRSVKRQSEFQTFLQDSKNKIKDNGEDFVKGVGREFGAVQFLLPAAAAGKTLSLVAQVSFTIWLLVLTNVMNEKDPLFKIIKSWLEAGKKAVSMVLVNSSKNGENSLPKIKLELGFSF